MRRNDQEHEQAKWQKCLSKLDYFNETISKCNDTTLTCDYKIFFYILENFFTNDFMY